MDYSKMLKEYRSKPKVKSLTTEIVRFEVPGQFLLGKITKVTDFETNKYDTACKKYLMDTVAGTKSFILGERLDNELEGVELVGKTLLVQYNGKVELDNGKRVNLFNIDDLSDIDTSELTQTAKEELKKDEHETNSPSQVDASDQGI
ncbi:MAG: hypothetical protein PHI02_09285 [Sulfurovaceae bacterium]|nr:hypothetical protein [Sulfurovaceae bacterium]